MEHEPQRLAVGARDRLADRAEAAIVLGSAPDGLPLVLHVIRGAPVASAVRASLGVETGSPLPPAIAAAIAELEQAAGAAAVGRGVCQIGLGRAYVSGERVGDLFGDTMVARMLGAHSPLVMPDEHSPRERPELVANTAALALSPDPVTVMRGVSAERHLIVPLSDGPVFVGEPAAEDDADGVREDSLQPLRFEDLRPVSGARFRVVGAVEERTGALSDAPSYGAAVEGGGEISWRVPRQSMGRALVELARSVQLFHDEGRVHGDVKPGNAVITAAGAVIIDPIGVAEGKVSPGATPGWAAPEQLLARPVVAATDVFALGLMLAQLLDAVVYGEERSFVVPVGGVQRRRVRMFGDPDVFIDPGGAARDGEPPALADDAARDAFAALICRCVAFDPDDRPASGGVFADELEALLDEHPLAGTLPLVGGPGRLHPHVEIAGVTGPAWVLSDQR